MRILQVIPHLPKGGAERVTVELSNALIEAGHEVTVLMAFPVDYNLNQRSLHGNVNINFLLPRSRNIFLVYIKLPFFVIRNWKDLKSYEVIHCHLTFGLVFGALVSIIRRITRLKNLRLIATCHVVGVGISMIPRAVNQHLSYFFDVFVLMAQDEQWRNFVVAKRRDNIEVVVNGVSAINRINPVKKVAANSTWTIGTISRLQKERKPWLILEVFSQVNQLTEGKVQFVLGGDGPERENLKALSERMLIAKNLSMPGLVQDPKTVLVDLDVYVSLNVESTTGIAGLEAVLSGIPTISIQLSQTYKSGAKDWIWSDQDPKLVAREIVNLLENPTSLEDLAKKQHSVAIRDYSVERMLNQYLNHYLAKP
jgi:glycosyltransferase involved in cell wall biosynthesis